MPGRAGRAGGRAGRGSASSQGAISQGAISLGGQLSGLSTFLPFTGSTVYIHYGYMDLHVEHTNPKELRAAALAILGPTQQEQQLGRPTPRFLCVYKICEVFSAPAVHFFQSKNGLLVSGNTCVVNCSLICH